VTRRELLAVVASIKHFHHYLYGKHFKVRSDHGALSWLLNFKNPEGQLARWFEVLASYDFRIEHRAGLEHSCKILLQYFCHSSFQPLKYLFLYYPIRTVLNHSQKFCQLEYNEHILCYNYNMGVYSGRLNA
jgi:hypothetical protein